MRKILAVAAVLVALTAGYLGAAHLSGGAFSTLGLALGGDRGELRRMALSFLEDLQFKDFEAAARYHAPELRESVDIPYLIQRLFTVKPEALEVMDYDVVFAELDSSDRRARVKTRIKVRFLGNGQVEERELMLYFDRDDEQSPWYMKLEDSLRELSPEEGKAS